MTSRDLARVVAFALALLGAIQLADPVTIGVSPEFRVWVGIVSSALGVVAGFLPKVQGGAPDAPTRRKGRAPVDNFTADEIAWIRHNLPPRPPRG